MLTLSFSLQYFGGKLTNNNFRAIHTNFHASFQVDSLKIAVFKNVAVAEALNAQMFDGIVIFEAGKRSSVLSF